jgi:hypothetical protein
LTDSIGTFRTDLGVNGTTPGRGEEAEYLAPCSIGGGFRGATLELRCVFTPSIPNGSPLPYLYRYRIEKGIRERSEQQRCGRMARATTKFIFCVSGGWATTARAR